MFAYSLPITSLIAISGPLAPYLLLIFGFFTLVIVYVLMALVDGVVLTLFRWNSFRASLTVALIMNAFAGLINGLLLIVLQHTPLVWIPVSFVISTLIDGFVLSYFRRDILKKDLLLALLVNIISYVLLILPAYYFGSRT